MLMLLVINIENVVIRETKELMHALSSNLFELLKALALWVLGIRLLGLISINSFGLQSEKSSIYLYHLQLFLDF